MYCNSVTPARQKRRFGIRSPSGLSPKHKQNFTQNKKPAWEFAELDFLVNYVKQKGGKENVNWKECSEALLIKFARNRSAKSCQRIYARHEEHHNVENSNRTTDSKEVQTEISIGPRDTFAWEKIKETESEANCTQENDDNALSYLRNLLEEDQAAVHATKVIEQNLHEQDSNSESNEYTKFASTNEHTCSMLEKKTKKRKKIVKRKPVKAEIYCFQKLSLLDSMKLKLVSSTRYIKNIASTIADISCLKNAIVECISNTLGEIPSTMTKRLHGNVSILMKKDFHAMEKFNFEDIVDELQEKFPELFQILLKIMVPKNKQTNDMPQDVVPRLALIYAITMQTRNPELSLLQRVVASCLADNISDQKMYDRLNTMGICVSYNRALVVQKQIGKHCMDLLERAVVNGKYIRFIGDNLNFSVGVSHETQKQHKNMVHMFASAALVSEKLFLDKSDLPQIPLQNLTPHHILISPVEFSVIVNDCVKLIVDVISTFLPKLQFMKLHVPESITGPDTHLFVHKTEVYPLPVLPYNEASYQDDVKILDYYEEVIQSLVTKVETMPNDIKIHIGGDQLTRERFGYATMLRLGNYDPKSRFAHLGPITFEFFHLGINYLEKIIFDSLWNSKGAIELGTMKCEKERIIRNSVDPDVMKAYDADKDFVVSYTNAFIVEACLDFFGMEDMKLYTEKKCTTSF